MSQGAPQSAGPRVWIVPGCTTAVVILMHLLPGDELNAESWWAIWHMDKVLHISAFAVCGLTWMIALAKQRRLQGAWRLEQVLLVGTVIFGTVLEVMQGALMSGRTFDWMDVAADVAGVGCSLFAFKVIFGRRPGRIAID